MKIIASYKVFVVTILFHVLFSTVGNSLLFAQNSQTNDGMSQMTPQALSNALKQANQEILALQKAVSVQNAKYQKNTDSLNAKIAENIALLGQNERALNLALENFQKKYDSQNQTITEFQDGLQAIKSWQLASIGIIVLLSAVILSVAVNQAFKKAYQKQTDYWNQFQASLFQK
jgi:hypothetical protein